MIDDESHCPFSILNCQLSISMTINLLTTDAELEQYDAWVRAHPDGTLWQSLAWKKYQEALGREVRIYAMNNEKLIMKNKGEFVGTALVVIDRTAFGLSVWEVPRGPLFNEQLKMNNEKNCEFLEAILQEAKKERCMYVLQSPLFIIHSSFFIPSKRHVHPEASLLIDLTQSEEEILKHMHQKGRYNIAVAKRHGVEIIQGTSSDIDSFYRLLTSTGSRDNFIILQKSRYKRFLESLDGSHLLLAMHQGKAIAGLLNVLWNGTAYYYYGASSYEDRKCMAPYLLQFEAMRKAKAEGCQTYDLLGIMPVDAPSNDPWKGITDFKQKFGGTLVTYPKEQICVLRPMLKKLLELKRKIGMRGRLEGSAP